MPLIQITNTYKGAVLDLVRECVPDGFEIRTLPENTTDALLERVVDVDYILASGRVKITEKVIARARRLKMIQRTGVGLDSLDLEALKRFGIPLYVNQGVNAQSVAEHTILLILACLRRLTEIDRNTKRGIWKKQQQGIGTRTLQNRTVGLIGLGKIGQRTATLLRAFHANVLFYDRYCPDPPCAKELGLVYTELEELLCKSDVISLHCPLTEETREVIRDSCPNEGRSGLGKYCQGKTDSGAGSAGGDQKRQSILRRA